MISDGRINLAMAVSYFNSLFNTEKDICCHTSFSLQVAPQLESGRICWNFPR